MKALVEATVRWFHAGIVLALLAPALYASPPDAKDWEAATRAGNFAPCFEKATLWLNEAAPADASRISEEGLRKLLEDPCFAAALAQRRLLAKVGVEPMGDFAKADRKNQQFVAWLLSNTEAMELCLLGATPVGVRHREADQWGIPVSALEIWQSIFHADQDSREGIYLKLAIATALNPPGTGNRGAGQAKTPEDPVERYRHFKTARENQELFPSFDHLSVWEYRQIVSSNASNADLSWAREMVRTWRPDLLVDELVVNSTSEVWRRFSPFPFDDTFKNVLAGGGKCGPRSSWAVFICQAHGLPAVGVRQPGHACAAYKTAYPHTQPQPGNAWKVVYGRAWHVSKACGLAGPEFMAAMEARSDRGRFSQIERLRWLASALTPPERAAAVLKAAEKVAPTTPKTGEGGEGPPAAADAPGDIKPEPAGRPKPGVIRIEAASFEKMSGAWVHDCFTGGKQIHLPKIGENWGDEPRLTYAVDVPETGVYGLTVQVAAVNFEQSVEVAVGTEKPVPVEVPNTRGLWAATPEVDLRLQKGTQTLTLTAPRPHRGITVRWLELKRK